MYDKETYFIPVNRKENQTCPKCKSYHYHEYIGFEKCESCGYYVDYHRGTYSE